MVLVGSVHMTAVISADNRVHHIILLGIVNDERGESEHVFNLYPVRGK